MRMKPLLRGLLAGAHAPSCIDAHNHSKVYTRLSRVMLGCAPDADADPEKRASGDHHTLTGFQCSA
jgi:hypothetical protein